MSLFDRPKLPVFSAVCAIVFLAACLVVMLNHEMWEDEMQTWLIARDSRSVGELFGAIKYDGHPCLWHVCLFAITRFTHNPAAMQFFNLLLGTSAMYIFLRYSPFSRVQKALFVFGYYALY